MRPGTRFRFTRGRHLDTHGDEVVTAYEVVKREENGTLVISTTKRSGLCRLVEPNTYQVVFDPAETHGCEHCGGHHRPYGYLVSVTLCPGGDDSTHDHGLCVDLTDEAACFEHYDDAEGYAARRSAAHPLGAAMVWTVDTEGPYYDVHGCVATLVRGRVLDA